MTQALLQSLYQTAQSSTMHILMTGFSPFDGRLENASSLAVKSLASQGLAVDTLEIPVVWGEPLARLKPICASHCPNIIISMGEGHVGEFTIEIVARNERAMRPDNRANTPLQRLIDPLGPALRNASIAAEPLCQRLRAHGWPIRVSTDAGAFLCEETLYSLESLKEDYPRLSTVVFVHLPPYGSQFQMNDQDQLCNIDRLSRFARHLRDAVVEIHGLTHGALSAPAKRK
jgi:pyroglutamyl-peptidase